MNEQTFINKHACSFGKMDLAKTKDIAKSNVGANSLSSKADRGNRS